MTAAGAAASPQSAAAQPWWLVLPGMNWRRRGAWPEREIANAIVAIACAVRLIAATGQGGKRRQILADTRLFRDWLNEAAGDADAFLRRFTLCLLLDIATPEDTSRDLREYAKTLHQHS